MEDNITNNEETSNTYINITSNDIVDCTICLQSILECDICETTCNHIYCEKCLEKWCKRGNKYCPMCRREIEKYKHNGEMTKLIMVNRPSRLNTVHIDIPEIEEIPINYIQINKMRFYGLKVFMAIHMLYTLYYMYNYSICRDNFNICYQILNKNNYTN